MSLNRSILATALTGASGAGGTLIYHHAIPWTWKEVLVKEGCYFLSSENEYKAVWSEHKTSLIKKISELKSSEQTFNKESIQSWCESQLKGNYSKDPSSSNNINSLCTHRGITTVKAKLILSGYDGFIDDEKDGDKKDLYRAVFGIYRYHPPFIVWLKEFNKDKTVTEEQLKEEAGVDTGHKALKSVCEFELRRFHKEIKDNDHFTYLYWWCKKLPYKTVEDLVKAKDSTWEFDGDGKSEKWKHTPMLMERINDARDSHEKTKKLTDLIIKGWCTSFRSSDLSEGDAYRHRYLILRYVCRKDNKKKKNS